MTDEKQMKPDTRAALLADAGHLLSTEAGSKVTLSNPRKLSSQHFMFRCDVDGLEEHPTVVIKKMDLGRNDGEGLLRFRNEMASLEFLTGLDIHPPLAPRLLARDREAGTILLEDLGDHETIQNLLFGEDDVLAEEALVQMGALLGGMHAATSGREAEFAAIQAAHETQSPSSDSTQDLRGQMEALQECFTAMRVEVSPDFYEAVAELEARVLAPEHPLRAFAHCDAGSHNFLATGDTVRGMDFEFGGYTCAMLDVVPARLAFPPSFRGHRVPIDVVMQMEDAYRDALSEGVAAARDEDYFNAVKVDACAHWAFSRIEGLWRNYLQSVVEVGEERTLEELGVPESRVRPFRRKVYTYVSHFVAAAVEYDELPAIRKPVKGLLHEMRRLWPDIEVMPLYPVWGNGGDEIDD
jgi:hypothetical protein